MGTTGDTEHAAILFADVKGYSVLISRDEVGTYERLRRARALFRALVGSYGGRIVDEAGDGVLAAFRSAGQAVDFALAVQRDLANAAAWQGEAGPFAFRMGIHAGPVFQDGDRLFGKTLVVAQRIQEVAPPGRVCISVAGQDEIGGRQDVQCVSLGDRVLKNLGMMRVYRVDRVSDHFDAEHARLAGETSSGAAEDASIAILPLENLSTLPTDQTLCDGVTIDIIERLSRFRDISVIARHSAFKCRAFADEPAELGQLLGVRYVAVGTLRRAGDQLRITAQLIETETSRTLWSERFDGMLAHVFEFQDEVASMIAARLATQVSAAERRRIISSPVPDIQTYGLVLRGQELMLQYKQYTNSHARQLFEVAAESDPAYSRVYSGLSRTFSLAWRYRWTDDPQDSLERATLLARQAIEHDSMDARGFSELGYAQLYRKRHEEALAAYERAILLNPNDADILADMSDACTCVGQPSRAVELMQRAMRLNPWRPDWYLWNYAEALFDLESYRDVIKILTQMRDPTEGQRLLAASHALIGNMEEAHHHAAAVRRAHPNFSLAEWRAITPNVDSPSQERFFEGLRLAGLE